MSLPTSGLFSQDKVFGRAVKELPPVLLSALEQAELLDAGLLKAFPRSEWVKLVTLERLEEVRRSTVATTASSTSISSTSAPFSPSLSVPLCGGTSVGVFVGSMAMVSGGIVPSLSSPSVSFPDSSTDSSLFASRVEGKVTAVEPYPGTQVAAESCWFRVSEIGWHARRILAGVQ